MKAIVVRAPGGLDQLEVRHLADPGQPGPGQIRVAVHATSLNFHDLLVANGAIPTDDGRILMSDAAGIVEAVGAGVTNLKPGDRVVVYLPVIIETVVIALACARIGAVHSLVFGGFSADAVRFRLADTGAKLLVTSDGQNRRGRQVEVKSAADIAAADLPHLDHVLVVRRTGHDVPWTEGRDVWWHNVVDTQPETHEPQAFDAEHPLFIIYTSGTTGTPKGVAVTHRNAAALVDAEARMFLRDDPIGPGEVLFSENFYQACRRCLNDGGILVTQNGTPFMQLAEVQTTAGRMDGLFADWHFYMAAVPTYIGGSMTFAWGSTDAEYRKLALEVLRQRFAGSGIVTRYYNPEIHQGAFALPQYVLQAVNKPSND